MAPRCPLSQFSNACSITIYFLNYTLKIYLHSHILKWKCKSDYMHSVHLIVINCVWTLEKQHMDVSFLVVMSFSRVCLTQSKANFPWLFRLAEINWMCKKENGNHMDNMTQNVPICLYKFLWLFSLTEVKLIFSTKK